MPLQHPLSNLTTRELLERLFRLWRSASPITLHDAARQGNKDVVQQIIESHRRLDEVDEHSRSALELAASSGCWETFHTLIEAGALADGILIPPPSLADLYFLICRGLKHSLKGFLFIWLATKTALPVPSYVVQKMSNWAPMHLIAMPVLYCLSAALVLNRCPTPGLQARAIIQALTKFQGETEHMFLMFLDSDPDLDLEDVVEIWSHAVERGQTGVCQRLLQIGFPVDWRYCHCEYPDVVTALLHSCGASHSELVLLLIGSGADPTLLDSHGRSCLLMASRRPYTKHAGSEQDSDAILEVLLETDAIQHIDTIQTDTNSQPPDITLLDRQGWPLVDLCRDTRVKAVRQLLENGANPNLKSDSGFTALHVACRWGGPETVEIVRLFVQFGGDVNAVDDAGWTPLGHAASIGTFVEVVEILIEAGAHLESTAGDATALQVAARHDVSGGAIAKYLAGKGAEVNAVGGKLGSVLLATLERPWSFVLNEDQSVRPERDPQPQIIDFLSVFLKHGLDLNLTPPSWQSPLHMAAQRNLPLVVSFLLSHGAKFPSLDGNASTWMGSFNPSDQSENPTPRRTNLQISILSFVRPRYHEIFRILLEHGAPADADATEFGYDFDMTVLGAACASSEHEFLRTAALLLEHGADPNFQDMLSLLPIQRAAYAVSVNHLQKLIECGASTDIGREHGSLFHSLCKGYARQPHLSSNTELFLSCFRLLDKRLSRALAWSQDSAGKNCLHYLAEFSEETYFIYNVDGTNSPSESHAVLFLREFLTSCANSCPPDDISHPCHEILLAQDSDGNTAFHIAAQRGDVSFMSVLIERIQPPDNDDEWDYISGREKLLALMTKPNKRGWNALHHAASHGRILACGCILKACQELKCATSIISGEMAQDLATKNDHYGVAEYIANFTDGLAGNENAMEKANNILVRVVANQELHFECPEDLLLEAVRAGAERHSLVQHANLM